MKHGLISIMLAMVVGFGNVNAVKLVKLYTGSRVAKIEQQEKEPILTGPNKGKILGDVRKHVVNAIRDGKLLLPAPHPFKLLFEYAENHLDEFSSKAFLRVSHFFFDCIVLHVPLEDMLAGNIPDVEVHDIVQEFFWEKLVDDQTFYLMLTGDTDFVMDINGILLIRNIIEEQRQIRVIDEKLLSWDSLRERAALQREEAILLLKKIELQREEVVSLLRSIESLLRRIDDELLHRRVTDEPLMIRSYSSKRFLWRSIMIKGLRELRKKAESWKAEKECNLKVKSKL